MSRKNSRLIEKIEKDQTVKMEFSTITAKGELYGTVDLPDGEWSVNELSRRLDATNQAFSDQYQTTSMGENDQTPIAASKLNQSTPDHYGRHGM